MRAIAGEASIAAGALNLGAGPFGGPLFDNAGEIAARDARKRALSHQSFLLGCTYLLAEVGFNKVNGLENQLRRAREPLLARCDGVDDARAASGSMKGRAKMVVVRATV